MNSLFSVSVKIHYTLLDSMSFNLSTVGEFFCVLYLIKFKRKKNRCRGFTSSTKSKIRQSHVVHGRKTAKNYAKKLSFLSSSSLLKFPSVWLLDVLSTVRAVPRIFCLRGQTRFS